jgi:copper homeostasis protein
MKKPFLFELCAETLESAKIAEAGGADRVELCSQLSISGITPDADLMQATVRAVSIPVYVLVRPRGGDFVYTDDEFAQIRKQTLEAKAAGAAGVAIGILLPNGKIDVARTREIAELAAPLKVTFHRAFDETVSLPEALEDVIRAGADCLLTSGGQVSVVAGARQIAALRQQAGDRIAIMAGGGVTLANIQHVAQATGVSYLHGSLIRKSDNSAAMPSLLGNSRNHAAADSGPMGRVHLEDVEQVTRILSEIPPPVLAL